MKKFISFSLAVVAAAALVGCGPQGEKGVATVNGEQITESEYRNFMALKNTVRVLDGNGQEVAARVAARLDFQVLQDVVQRQVVMQMAKDANVYPDDAAIIQEIEYRKKQNPNYVKQLNMNGINFDTIKSMIAYELAEERLITQGVTVSGDEAKQFIKDNPQNFTDPATADLLYVLVGTDAKKAEVDKMIASGQSFSLIATQMSDDPNTKRNGAKFPNRNLDQYPPDMKAQVQKTSPGNLTGWVRFPEGWARFFVERKAPANLRTLTPEQEESVRRQLAIQRGRQATDIEKKLMEKLTDSQIKVNESSLAEMWKTYMERVKENAAAAAPTGATGAAPTEGAAPAPAEGAGKTGN